MMPRDVSNVSAGMNGLRRNDSKSRVKKGVILHTLRLQVPALEK